MFKRTALALAAASIAAVTIQTASAADLPIRQAYKAPAPLTPVWSWTGFYAGINGGFGGNNFNYPFDAPEYSLHGNANLTSSGFLFGGQLGYNWQTGPWVWGVETDIQWANIKGDVSANASGPGGSLNLSAGSELEWFGTVRGRVGYAWDRVMLYATGGYAYGSVNTFANASLTGEGNFSFSRSNTKNGWTVGGGLEYAMTPNLMFKTEYLYMDLGSSTVYSIPEFRISEDTTVHLVRAGLNWKFGGVW